MRKLKPWGLIIAAAAFVGGNSADAYALKHYVGGDVSLLPDYEKAGAIYKTHEGKPIADVLTYCHEVGMNAMRVRLFVNPDDYTGDDKDSNACQDLEYILPLCKRIKDAGLDLMLDFHYSDSWADPAKQTTPKAWANMTDQELYQEIYDYTKDCLQKLNEAGATPDFIQPGNEISYGMLWGPEGTSTSSQKKCLSGSDANWERFGTLLKNAIKACREECPDAQIVIHTERVSKVAVQRNFYQQMKAMDIDYDIIGLSYYPYFHGTLNVLNNALYDLDKNFPEKQIMIVETGYPYKWEVPGTNQKVDYPYSDAGQDQFAKDLIATLEKYEQVDGLFWWWLEYNAYNTNLAGWYNAPLFDSSNGRATSALKTICSFANDAGGVEGILEVPAAGDVIWYDIYGRRIPNPAAAKGLRISSDGIKILAR